jgi:hypothetical protein
VNLAWRTIIQGLYTPADKSAVRWCDEYHDTRVRKVPIYVRATQGAAAERDSLCGFYYSRALHGVITVPEDLTPSFEFGKVSLEVCRVRHV